jgi:hypothetical protein
MTPNETAGVMTHSASRRAFRFSLKALLVVITLIAIFLGNWTYRARQQEKVVQLITRQGGDVIYDYEFRGAKESRWPKWLRTTFGEDYFRTVELVTFDDPLRGNYSLSDQDAQLLRRLPWLKGVTLSDTGVTTDGLEFVRSLNRLESLALMAYPRSVGGDGAGLAVLRNKSSLRQLELVNVPRPRGGLVFLHGLTRLEYLNLFGMKLKDDDLRELGSLRALQKLSLNRTPITNDGLIHLTKLTRLKELLLGCEHVDSNGLQHIQKIRSLQSLDLYGTKVDDSAVEILSRFDNLIELRLGGTKVTSTGIESIRKLLPNCKVKWKSWE